MRQLLTAALVLATVGCAGLAYAADKKEDPTGTWKWSVTSGEDTWETTLKLKLDGDKLTGTIIRGSGKESAIEDGKFVGNEVSFKVVREREGQKMVNTYSGKLSGDTIKGKVGSGGKGARSHDWQAKRVKS